MNRFLIKFAPVLDILVSPIILLAAPLLRKIRTIGVYRFPIVEKILYSVGVFPVKDHFYEPSINNRHPRFDYSCDRNLPGINWDTDAQFAWLKKLVYADELQGIKNVKPNGLEFFFTNGSFESGDAEYWYQMVRAVKPKRLIEIGSGNSTLLAIRAIEKTKLEDPEYSCEHICIEPYEMPWLETTGVTVVREKVEDIGVDFFSSLNDGDILFIDSSHIIRPQGDVLFEYLELLPSLKEGVIVHIHDIFTPRDYLEGWLKKDVKFWNEQYLLEAFLSQNSKWRIVGALNWLHHNHYQALNAVAPYLTKDREPGSFYIQKVSSNHVE